MVKLTYEYVFNYFKEHNCELLETKYINANTSMEYRCECGDIAYIRFGHFQNGQRCRKCKNKKIGERLKFTYEEVYNHFLDQGCELLEDTYINCKTKMKYKCNCGDISYINFDNFYRGKRCKKCGAVKIGDAIRLSYECVYNYFKEQGCELLEDNYINCNISMKYKCICGNISYITYGSFKQGHRCMECSGTEKLTYEYVFNYFKENNCLLLESTYVDYSTPMKYQCECGNISKISFGSFRRGSRCRKCKIVKISGENSPHWNHDLTNEDRLNNRRREFLPQLHQWRKQVFERDNYTC